MGSILPDNLKNRNHDDWPWPFSLISRSATAFDWGRPTLVVGVGLNRWADFVFTEASWERGKVPKPITTPNSLQVSYYPSAPWYWKWAAWYIAYSFPRNNLNKKFHQFRLGARWDNVDNYVNWPTFPTLRAYTGDDSQNTQDW